MLLIKRIMIPVCSFAVFALFVPLLFLASRIYYILVNSVAPLTYDRLMSKASYIIFITGLTYLFSYIIFLVILFLVLKKFISPLRKTLDLSKKLAAGDFSHKIKVDNRDEIGELSRSINHMKDRLQYSLVKLKNSYKREKHSKEEAESANQLKTDFLSKVSKELHMPLTPILSYSNLVIAQINDGKYDKDLEKKIRTIRECADNMLNITSNLDELSRLEAGMIDLNYTEFDSSGLIEELYNLHHFSATHKAVVLQCVYTENFPKILHTDREILFHILSNILAYTIHYSPEKSEIEIRTEADKDDIVFIISDKIAGAQAKTIGEIFKKSSDRVSNMALHLSNARLFGLVSSIANAELLGGSLEAESFDKTGTIFKLILDSESITPKDKKTSSMHIASNIK